MSGCTHDKWMWFGDGRRYCADCGEVMSGPPLTKAAAKRLVTRFRDRHPEAVKFWEQILNGTAPPEIPNPDSGANDSEKPNKISG